MAGNKKASIKITADSKQAEKDIKHLQSEIKGFEKTTKALNIASDFNAATLALKNVGDAFSKVSATVTDLINTYNVQAQAERQLEAAARNNPYLNDYAVEKLKSFAGELQGISTYGDEQMLPLMAQLATAGRSQAEIMDIMSASIDVAASGTMSLESAVKALNGTYSGQLGVLSKTMPQLKDLTGEELKNGAAVRQVDFVTDFLAAKQQDLIVDMQKKGTELNQLHTTLVFEKMMDRVLQWLLINNIRQDKSYIAVKAGEARMTILAAIGEINRALLLNDGFMNTMDAIAKSYTEEIIAGLCAIKDEESKNS